MNEGGGRREMNGQYFTSQEKKMSEYSFSLLHQGPSSNILFYSNIHA